MKKATLTIGLFTLVMSITSFATPTTATPSIAENTSTAFIDGTGTQDSGRTKKVDFNGNTSTTHSPKQLVAIDGTGTQDSGRTKKVD